MVSGVGGAGGKASASSKSSMHLNRVDLIHSNFALASKRSDFGKFDAPFPSHQSSSQLLHNRRRFASTGRNLLHFGKRLITPPFKAGQRRRRRRRHAFMSGYLIGKTPFEHNDTGSCFSLPPEHNDLSPSSSLNVLIREFNQSNYASVLNQLSQQNNCNSSSNSNNNPSQSNATDATDAIAESEESSFPRIHRSRGGLYYEYPVHTDRAGSQHALKKLTNDKATHFQRDNLIAEVGSVQELLDRMNVMIAKSRKRGRSSSRRQAGAGKVTARPGSGKLSGYTTDCSVEDDALSLASVSSEFEYHDIHPSSAGPTALAKLASRPGGSVTRKVEADATRPCDEVNARAEDFPTHRSTQVLSEALPGEPPLQQEAQDDQVKRVVRLQRAKTRVIRHAEDKPQFPIDATSQPAVVAKTATLTKSRPVGQGQSQKLRDGQITSATRLEQPTFGFRQLNRATRIHPSPTNAFPVKIASRESSRARRRAK